MWTSPDRSPWASSAFRSRSSAGKFCPRSDVLGGDSRSQASWMLYSSLKRTTTLMSIHINASSFSTVVESDPRTLFHPDRTAAGNVPMIDARSSSFEPIVR